MYFASFQACVVFECDESIGDDCSDTLDLTANLEDFNQCTPNAGFCNVSINGIKVESSVTETGRATYIFCFCGQFFPVFKLSCLFLVFCLVLSSLVLSRLVSSRCTHMLHLYHAVVLICCRERALSNVDIICSTTPLYKQANEICLNYFF